MHKTLACVIAISFLFAGCAAAVPWNKQNYAGVTYTHVKLAEIKDAAGHVTGTAPTDIEVIDGKEKQAVTMNADIAKGTVSYNASGVLAFAGQKNRADVEALVTEHLKNLGIQIAPEVMKALVDIVTKAIGIP